MFFPVLAPTSGSGLKYRVSVVWSGSWHILVIKQPSDVRSRCPFLAKAKTVQSGPAFVLCSISVSFLFWCFSKPMVRLRCCNSYQNAATDVSMSNVIEIVSGDALEPQFRPFQIRKNVLCSTPFAPSVLRRQRTSRKALCAKRFPQST